MTGFPSSREVAYIRQKYPAGTRIRLVAMRDPFNPIPPGDGTVEHVDDAGQIWCKFDCGRSGLAVVPGVDAFYRLEDHATADGGVA